MANFYDEIEVDIESCHEEMTQNRDLCSRNEHYLGAFHKFLYRKNHHHRFIDSGFFRYWFDEFYEYWNEVLGGRPLKFHDFFYLYSHYRRRFQSVEVQQGADKHSFLWGWQRPENIYLTFHFVYRFALEPFSFLPFRPYLKPGSRVLEYGCGLAPIVTSMIKSRLTKYQYTIADIRNFPYHYSKYRLRQHGVRFIDLTPYEEPLCVGPYDIVFLMTVLEHLPNPVEVVEAITQSVRTGGHLVFDYIRSSGSGLDTQESVEQRPTILDFISSHYEIVSGNVDYDKSMGTTIVRKK